MEFAEVLEQKIRSEILSEIAKSAPAPRAKKGDFPSENPVDSSSRSFSPSENMSSPLEKNHFSHPIESEIFGLAWLMGHTEKAEKPVSRGKTAYGVKARPRPPHKMNKKQRNAYCYFQSYNLGLEENFSRRDLQKAFREIAKRVHPDHGGSAEEFIALKGMVEVMASVFIE